MLSLTKYLLQRILTLHCVPRETAATVYRNRFAFQKLSAYIMEVPNQAYVNTIDGDNILPYHTLFISIDDVQDAIEDMKMEHESTLAKTFKRVGAVL